MDKHLFYMNFTASSINSRFVENLRNIKSVVWTIFDRMERVIDSFKPAVWETDDELGTSCNRKTSDG
jgi:hypothetical protein